MTIAARTHRHQPRAALRASRWACPIRGKAPGAVGAGMAGEAFTDLGAPRVGGRATLMRAQDHPPGCRRKDHERRAVWCEVLALHESRWAIPRGRGQGVVHRGGSCVGRFRETCAASLRRWISERRTEVRVTLSSSKTPDRKSGITRTSGRLLSTPRLASGLMTRLPRCGPYPSDLPDVHSRYVAHLEPGGAHRVDRLSRCPPRKVEAAAAWAERQGHRYSWARRRRASGSWQGQEQCRGADSGRVLPERR